MKIYVGKYTVHLQAFLTTSLVGGEWLPSRYARFNPGNESTLPTG